MTKGSLPDGVPSDNSSRLRKDDAASLGADGALLNASSSLRSISTDVSFAATNTATPEFAQRKTGPAPSSQGELASSFPREDASRTRFSRVVVEVEEDEDEDDDEDKKRPNGALGHGQHLPAPMLILIAIGLLLAALGAYVTSQNQDPQPYCSQQPDWNQFNCQAD